MLTSSNTKMLSGNSAQATRQMKRALLFTGDWHRLIAARSESSDCSGHTSRSESRRVRTRPCVREYKIALKGVKNLEVNLYSGNVEASASHGSSSHVALLHCVDPHFKN